jgi:hypothetical protein
MEACEQVAVLRRFAWTATRPAPAVAIDLQTG